MPALSRMRLAALICVVVGGVAHADLAVDGKQLPPSTQEVTIDGVTVRLEVDRSVVVTGDTVKATLVAFGETPVTVDLSALHTSNHAADYTDTKWDRLDHKTIRLTAAMEGGPPVVTAFKLGTRLKQHGLIDSFKIFVAAKGTQVPIYAQYPETGHPTFEQVEQDGTAAAINIQGWSGNTIDLAIKAEGPVTLDQPFTIAVRVKNTSGTGRPGYPFVELTTLDALTPRHGDRTTGLEIEHIADPISSSTQLRPWGRGVEYVARFKVTPHTRAPHQLAFLATAMVYSPNRAPALILAGAIDAATFAVAPK